MTDLVAQLRATVELLHNDLAKAYAELDSYEELYRNYSVAKIREMQLRIEDLEHQLDPTRLR